MKPNIKDIIKDNTVNFSHYREGILYYNVTYETIKYHYVVNEFDHTIIVFNEKNIGIHISYSEFDEYFDDIRDFLIDSILN